MDAQQRENSMKTANDSAIYSSLALWTVVTVIGVFLRFAFDSLTLSLVSWAILALGFVMCCVTAFKILNAK
ncbi:MULTISPECIES: hypothetical protein [Pedobacter]|jgi:ABC-type transport system involved in multi-copper enzyme maturation permease subunit|uniref:hypothetical protein n=1 Tax=Nubsella zeaxanthinifaciens TaxID=392412 RepID=UPI000DE293A9|nr:hypothetical protein [Nubsella zeaxanthinifaciens]